MDKASPHYRSKKVREYFDKHKDTLIPQYTFQLRHHRVYGNGGDMEYGQERPAGAKILYPSFSDFKKSISCYFRTKRLDLNMRTI